MIDQHRQYRIDGSIMGKKPKKTSRKIKIASSIMPQPPYSLQAARAPMTIMEKARARIAARSIIPAFEKEPDADIVMRARFPLDHALMLLNLILDTATPNLYISREYQRISSYAKTQFKLVEAQIDARDYNIEILDSVAFKLSGTGSFNFDRRMLATMISLPVEYPRYVEMTVRKVKGEELYDYRVRLAIPNSKLKDKQYVWDNSAKDINKVATEDMKNIITADGWLRSKGVELTMLNTISGQALIEMARFARTEANKIDLETPFIKLQKNSASDKILAASFPYKDSSGKAASIELPGFPLGQKLFIDYSQLPLSKYSGAARAFIAVSSLERLVTLPLQAFSRLDKKQYAVPDVQIGLGNDLSRNYFAYPISQHSYIIALVPAREFKKGNPPARMPRLKSKKKS